MVQWVLYQMKLPPALSDKLSQKLSETLAAHQMEVRELELQMKTVADEATAIKLNAKHDALLVRGRKITIHNLIRIALANGMPAVESPANALALLNKHGVGSGRPRVRS